MKGKLSGIILHISSLPSETGIGDFGKGAYKFIDFLVESKQSLWQILPLGPTGFGDSPYQSFSSFAGNPYFIDLEDLVMKKFISNDDLKLLKDRNNLDYIDYELIYNEKMRVLRIAFEKFYFEGLMEEVEDFRKENSFWLEDYALYMSLKNKFSEEPWYNWSKGYREREEKVLAKVIKKFKKEIEFYIFLQYIFFSQWENLKKYANDRGIQIIGDIPIFTALDSSDTWSKPKMFQLFKNGKPKKVAGCPPDSFTEDGQLWGNPLYDWKYMSETKYLWWVERVKNSFKCYDIVRIDHFRGFESYWSIPPKDKTAKNGRWEKGPGIKLFTRIKKVLGEKFIIAEDLGFLTTKVKSLLKKTGFPGMKILLFAFDPSGKSDYLPHKYNENSVAYTGTHDNETVLGWYREGNKKQIEFCEEYLSKMKEVSSYEINWKFIEAIWSTKSKMVLTQMQDLLGLDNRSRMNTPGTNSGNWTWRVREEAFNSELAKRLRDVTIKNNR